MASPQVDIQRRGPQDNRFRWDPTLPLKWDLAVTGDSVAYTEVTDIAYYEIGITPDLGWANQENMFLPYNASDSQNSNAKLFTLSNLSVDLSTLTYDEESRDVYVDLTDAQVNEFLVHGYPDYLWAIRGYTQRGEVSKWSSIRKFAGIQQAPERWFDIEDIESPSKTRTITLYGEKNPSIATIEINGDTGLARYPSSTMWAFDTTIEPGNNNFQIRGHPTYGKATAYKSVQVELSTVEVGLELVPNTFDHFGALHGVDRLSILDESNDDYKRRIKDVFIHPAGSNLPGLHNSIARQIDTDFDDFCLIIRPRLIEIGRRADDLYPMSMEITTNKIFVDSPGFTVSNEHHVVEPQSLTVYLDFDMSAGVGGSQDIQVSSSPGVIIPESDYRVDISSRTITFLKNSYQYKNVWVSYSRKLGVDIGVNISLSQVKTALESLSFDSRTLLTVDLSVDRVGTETSDGLLRGVYPLRSSARYVDVAGDTQLGLPIRWSDLSIHHLLDTGYWSRHLNEDGHILNTRIESHVDSFKKYSHRSWEQTVLDKDVWDPVDEITERSNHMWRLWDSIRGYWRSSNVNVTARYSTTQAFDRNFIIEEDKSIMKYYGIPKTEFKSGVGRDQDLKLVIKRPSVIEELTAPDVFRGSVSWSITGQSIESSYLPPTQWGSLFFSP